MDARLRLTFFSDRFTEMFGRPASVALGMRRIEVDRTDCDNPAWRAHADDLAKRRAFRDFETTFVDASGLSRPVKISGAPLFGRDGAFKGYIGVGHDLTELRRREREAFEHAADLKSILENIDQGVVLLDRNFDIAAYNRHLVEWLQIDDNRDYRGLSYEWIVRELAERGEFAPEDKETAVATRLRQVRAGERFVGERPRRDGRIVSATFNPLPAGGGVMTYSDVTEARDREARLASSEESFRHLFMHSPLPKWVYSVATLRFLEVNDAAVAKYGYSRDEFLSMNLKDIQPPEDVERLLQWSPQAPVDRLHARDWRHRCRDGKILDVDIFLRDIEFGGEPARLAAIVDNSARKKAERQTARIFETSQDVILVTDGDGKITEMSPSSATVLGYRPEEMIGRNAGAFIFADDLVATRREMKAARHGSKTRNFACRSVHKEGHAVALMWMAVWSEPDRRHFFIGRDMTEYNRTEEQLRQAQKMEAVGQLTGGVAHDFNNILTVITANAEAMEEEANLDPRLLDRIAQIGDATDRAATLTRQLLAFSRKQALRPQRTNVNDLVATTGGLLRRSLGEHVDVQVVLADGLWTIEIDRGQLESALVNLCINARDAMAEGGRLLIETANRTLDEDYVAKNADVVAGDYVMLSVSDTGTGMAADLLDKVFEPFFTTKEVGKGSGLGLSMVYGFVKQSQGHIAIDSEVGRGTAIALYLPRSGGEQLQAAARPRLRLPRGNERILVVEDNEQVRASVVEQLRNLGYAVAEAADGAAGLAAFEAAAPPYDLLLTDVIMPGELNGKALADVVTRRWPATKVVLMSGYSDGAIVHDGRLDAGVLLLSKPFRRGDLARMLRRALDGVADPE